MDEMVVRIRSCGFCATDYKAIKGIRRNMTFRFIPTPLAMSKAIRLMASGLVDPEKIVSHRFALKDIHKAVEVMGQAQQNKVMINP